MTDKPCFKEWVDKAEEDYEVAMICVSCVV